MAGISRIAALLLLFGAGAVHAAGSRCDAPAEGGAFTLSVGGTTRAFLVHVPSGKPERPAPLVFAFHGLGGSAQEFADHSDFDHVWPEAVRVYPQGVYRVFEERPQFRGDGWQIRPGELEDRDLRFFDALLAWISDRYCIDPHAVFATGFSNGGFVSNLLGCLRPKQLAAIAPVAGGMVCTPADPVPALVIHGTADRTVEFELGVGAARKWAVRDGCAEGSRDDEHGCKMRSSCTTGEVGLCAVPTGHRYEPGYTKTIVDFFKRRLAVVDSGSGVH